MIDEYTLTQIVELFIPGMGIGAGLCAIAWLIGFVVSWFYNLIRKS